MGCDIHAIVERKQVHKDRDGRVYRYEWLNAGDPDLNRNYELFAALADVRNSYGITPVAEPRGLPSFAGTYEDGELKFTDYDDAPCDIYQRYYREWYGDAHSSSWLSLAEMKAYDATVEIEDPRVIVGRSPEGAVTAVAGWTSGPHEGPVGRRRIFTWPGESAGEPSAWDDLVAFMETIRAQHDLSDNGVRLVFFFDN